MKYEPLISDAFYHIYNCGNNKEDIFIEDKNYEYFLSLIKKHVLKVCDIFSYCLLKNHFHLLIKTKEGLDNKLISQSFSNLFNAYAKAINKSYNRSGSLFKDRFSRIRVKDEKYLKSLIIYINSNAVHHGFTVNIANYRHSSYGEIISKNESLVKSNYVLDLFENTDNFSQVILEKQELIKELTLE